MFSLSKMFSLVSPIGWEDIGLVYLYIKAQSGRVDKAFWLIQGCLLDEESRPELLFCISDLYDVILV